MLVVFGGPQTYGLGVLTYIHENDDNRIYSYEAGDKVDGPTELCLLEDTVV